MARMIFCRKLGKYMEGLEEPQYPGELGEKIHKEISKKAWDSWISQQTMLINENAINVLESESREFLEREMMKYLFGNAYKS